jgi:hypothetical protein
MSEDAIRRQGARRSMRREAQRRKPKGGAATASANTRDRDASSAALLEKIAALDPPDEEGARAIFAEAIERGLSDLELEQLVKPLAKKLGVSATAVKNLLKGMRTEAMRGEKAGPGPMLTARAPSQATTLVKLARGACEELFHDAEKEAYVSIRTTDGAGSHRETYYLRSTGCRRWLGWLYYRYGVSAPSNDAMAAAISTLEAIAVNDGPERETFLRAGWLDGKLYLDLVDDRWRAVEIDPAGRRVVEEPPARFCRAKGMQPLPEPVPGDPKQGLALLRALLRIPDDRDFVIVVSALLAALAARGPFVILNFIGEPGAAKTSTVKMLRMLIDPNMALTRSPPKNEGDVYIAANKSLVLVYNNLSYVPQWLSDIFCVVTEGSGFSKRRLFTDDEEALLHARVPIFITGVANVMVRGDAADRTANIGLGRIPEEARLTEEEYFAGVEAARPAILGALLSGLSVGLKQLPTLRRSPLPRMASFARWGMACESAYWEEGTFLNSYAANIVDSADDVIQGDKAVATFVAFMATRGSEWQGTATQLLEELVAFVHVGERVAEAELAEAEAGYATAAKAFDPPAQIDADTRRKRAKAKLADARTKARETLDRGWPKLPQFLAGGLKSAGDALRKTGIEIIWPSRHGKQKIIVAKYLQASENTRETTSQASPASQGVDALSIASKENNGLADRGGDAAEACGDAAGRSGHQDDKRLKTNTNPPPWDDGDARDAVLRRSSTSPRSPTSRASAKQKEIIL